MENNWYSNNGNENGQGNYSSDGYYTPNEKKKKGVTPVQFIVCLLAVALIFGTAGAYLGGRLNREQTPASDPSNIIVEEPNKDSADNSPAETPAEGESKPESGERPSEKLNIAAGSQDSTGSTGVVQNCMASVVGIYVGNTTISYATGETQEQDTGSGSGVIITDDGYIVTNNHVVQGADTIHVYLQDGTKYDAKLIGTDTFSDLAIVKIDVANLPAATIGSSGNVTVGDTVYAIGNPLGVLTSSVSKGIISGLDRTITIDGISMTLMQTDASINPGNSGGGLFNDSGELIGIVNAKSASVEVEGLGFAIPVDSARPVITDLVDLGYVTGRPYIGITMQDVSLRYGNSNNRNNPFSFYMDNYVTRVQVMSVESGSAAEKGGLLVNDILMSLNGKEITGSSQFAAMLYEYKVGDTVTITVLRGNETKDPHCRTRRKVIRRAPPHTVCDIPPTIWQKGRHKCRPFLLRQIICFFLRIALP